MHTWFRKGEVERVRFQNVPCFVYKEKITVSVDGIGDITADVVCIAVHFMFIWIPKK
ncbi:proline racemase family protein [Desulfosporosinus metallidurans]|uniref:proline racemase family protein n=1 Tax=Desulfosporosinus metallidurans TaxID=1888891 RepID=UPI001F218AEA|nr:proline racemase family protein [Desulfosporosinus metallidurans]